jgi:hypothetical protein
MDHVVEYIGKDGIIHSKFDWIRIKTPHVGDLVDFGDSLGRIESLDWGMTGKMHVCETLGSAFLGKLRDGTIYLSISGGPFRTINPEDLEPTMGAKVVPFWNWGNNGPGGSHGVEYHIARPIFKYIGD